MSDYGKFATAEELLKGYNELEKSFTQKCQQLSALEKQLTPESNGGTSGAPDQSPSPSTDATHRSADGSAEALTVPSSRNADGSYDGAREASLPPRIMTDGGSVSAALPDRPKTLKEASELAKKYFN